MNIDEMLEILETRHDVVLLPYQKMMLLRWLKMTKEERKEYWNQEIDVDG